MQPWRCQRAMEKGTGCVKKEGKLYSLGVKGIRPRNPEMSGMTALADQILK